MKAPRFWYPNPADKIAKLEAAILSPLSLFFTLGTAVRRASAKPFHANVPLVCIGNAVAGGSGKTPTALALAQILKAQRHKPVFVTKGYGGSGETVCVDPERHKVADVGDEALLLAAVAPTWAGRDRVASITEAQANGSIVIMDDGMQNPHVAPTTTLLVVDGESGIGNGRIIPAGPLREPFDEAAARATAMIVVGRDRHNLAARVKCPVLRAHIEARIPTGFPSRSRFVAFAGIAHPEKFFATALRGGLSLASERAFADHHLYSDADIEALRLEAEVQGARLLTTAKDAVRLPPEFRAQVVVLPVRLVFDTAGAERMLVEMTSRG